MDAPQERDPEERRTADPKSWSLPAVRKPVPELVADRVVDMVRSGELQLGDRLPNEPELARNMGVARSSLRTALQRLKSIGILEVTRGRGWYVSGEPGQRTADLMLTAIAEREFAVPEVLEVRMSLEATAASLAAVRATTGQLDEIAKLSLAHREAPFDNREALLETDEAFHSAVVLASGNAYLQTMYDMLTPLIVEWRRSSFTMPEVHDRSGLDHNQIVVQLRRKDEVGARLTMTSHLMALYKTTLRDEASGEHARSRTAADVSTYVDVRDTPLWTPLA